MMFIFKISVLTNWFLVNQRVVLNINNNCPLNYTINLIGTKWKTYLLFHLLESILKSLDSCGLKIVKVNCICLFILSIIKFFLEENMRICLFNIF